MAQTTATPLPRNQATRQPEEARRITVWRALRPLAYALIVGAVTLAAVRFATGAPGWIEAQYAERVYPAIAWFMGMLTGWFSFSLAELLLYALCIGVVLDVLLIVWRLILRPQRVLRLVRSVARLLLFASVAYALFIGGWGLNYYRQPFATFAGYDVHPSERTELVALCMDLLDSASTLRAHVPEDDGGVFALSDEKAMLEWVPDGYFEAQLPGIAVSPARVKRVFYSRGMSRLNITGIFTPFSYESNLNMEQPDYTKPLTAAHEGAHLRGIAREDEASFVGYLVCMRSGNAQYQYSAAMFALEESLSALGGSEAAQIRELMPDALRRDIASKSAYWKQYEGKAAEVHHAINDAYLKSNGQEDGTKSYGRVVDLLLALRRKLTGAQAAVAGVR